MAETTIFAPTGGPGEILAFSARRHPDKIALITADRRLTYTQLDELSHAVAATLHQRGIGAGDVVSLYGQNSWEWIVSYHAALRVGAVVNPINVMLTQDELAYVLDDCGAQALFTGADQLGTALSAARARDPLKLLFTTAVGDQTEATPFNQVVEEGAGLSLSAVVPSPGDLCSIAYTSGTTGHPKGAMQSHRSVLLNCALTATMHGRTAADVVVTALPSAHVYGNVAINGTFLAGGTVVLMERFDPGEALRLIGQERATMFEGVPAMYSMMLGHPSVEQADLSSLRTSTVGGQTFAVNLLEAWQHRTGAPLLELWGMTEIAGLGATHSIYAPAVPGSIGVSLPGVELRVASFDDAECEAPTGEAGELVVRGPIVMSGYYGRPEATAEALSADGWLHTGDVAYMDESGHFFVVDRLKDMILTAGYNVYPAEIERVIGSHPDVALVAVGKRSDEVRGEVAVAYIVERAGAGLTQDAVLEFCRDKLAAYKRPRAVVFTDQLPTTSSGKLMRRKLAQLDVVPGVHGTGPA